MQRVMGYIVDYAESHTELAPKITSKVHIEGEWVKID